ncbi:GGDEF domain-containing protein [Halomonas rhizosphaerae]|uniref:diguanylate cyclase n=1 Tax=Halomonas rhizosphaerae TaxID=3043296 RepID=A0ABT6V2Z8_9GAMM|nr:GGDEF domain-containing protein [Halomonas rhizosphaerae]MDI5892316.1 GGDEF domain-containing protein [Halomonas rhizosphaerae]
MATDAGNANELDWRGEFRDSAKEALFRRTMQAHDACQLRHALVVATVLFLAFSLTDFSLLGSSTTFLVLLAMRATVAASFLLLALAVWRRPSLAQTPMPINLVCLLAVSGVLLTIPLKPDDLVTSLASIVTASMALYLFIPNRLPWMLASNAYLLGGFLILVVVWSPLPGGVLANSLLLLGFVNLLCWLTVSRIHRLQRAQFASLLEERAINRRLKEEIEERNQLEQRLRHMARTDELTGITNRRRFFELAEQERRRAHRDGTPLSLCMVDIDYFKAINDIHGHAIGDLALTVVAARCQSVLRESDIIGRYGGEEFVIALPLANLLTAREIAERLRQAVCRQPLEVKGVVLDLTVTVGISRVDDGEMTLDPGLLRADRALYAGKESGRNCVVMTPQGPELTLLESVPTAVTPGAVRATASVAAPAAIPAGGRLPGRS